MARAAGSDGRRATWDVRRGCGLAVDRFARRVKQLVMALEQFRTLGIEFISHQEVLDTSTPMGKAKPFSP
jgi:DNA invertase Pin-like site-specific DNA recombinase